jgi:hypothetical protein
VLLLAVVAAVSEPVWVAAGALCAPAVWSFAMLPDAPGLGAAV